MPVTVRLPTALRSYAGNRATLEVAGSTVSEVVRRVAEENPGLARQLLDDRGEIRSFVNVYLNQTDVRHLSKGATPVKDGDVLVVVPAVAGGARPASRGAGGLDADEIGFYARHLIMPEVGLRGQEKLKNASVLVVGAGGLGSPTSLYLAAAGVGRLGLVDMDVVDASNLHRQVLYSAADVGRPKLAAAKDRLEGLNPHVEVEVHETAFTSANALDLLADYDVLVDGTDNFPTRYLSNDAAVLAGKPNVYGSIFRFEGQASVFDAKRGPCYRCLYPQPPPPGLVPSCAEGGVLGVLPGIVGCIQATETVKLLLGVGEPLVGRLLLFDALAMSFTELSIRKDPACPICGPNATIRELVDYEEFCGIPQAAAEALDEQAFALAPVEVAKRAESGSVSFVDVREPHEWEICRLEGATLIPLGEFAERVGEIPLDRDVVVYCRSGARSGRATSLLRKLGYRRVWNLDGGILRWAAEVDPSLPAF